MPKSREGGVMSSSHPNPLSFPSPVTYTTAAISPFDIPGITRQIEQAVATLKPEERASVTVKVDRVGAGGGLVVRGPFNTSVLAVVTKPYAGRFEWSLSGRVAWLKMPDPLPVRVSPELRGLYRLFRKLGSNPVSAAVKAVRVNGGAEVRIGR
jgi:hypothetical protein